MSRRLLLVSHRPIDFGGGGSVRWRYLTGALPSLGWDVTMVTARANPTSDEASTDARRAHLAALRARVMNAAGASVRPLFVRAGVQPEAFAPNLAWAVTGRGAVARAIAREAPDVVLATGPPQSAIFAAVTATRAAGVPVVAELRDLWAGNPYFDAGGTLLSRLEARSLRRANAIVTVTPGCRDTFSRLHPEFQARLRLLPNGFDPTLLELRDGRSGGIRGRPITMVHAGALYGDRSAAALVRAVDQPALRDEVRLELVGAIDQATRDAVRAASGRLDVAIHPPVGWHDAIERVRDADISVVINSAGTGGAMALPSKLYEALALGRPVLALTPPGSDTERLLRSFGQVDGFAPADDADAIAAALSSLLRSPPEPVPTEQLSEYSRAAVARQLTALLDELTGASAASQN